MKKILILDDNLELLHEQVITLNAMKDDTGFEVFGTASAEEAYAILAKGQTQLLLLDLVMPEVDGISVLHSVKRRYPDVKVIIHTGHAEREVSAQLFKDGADAVLHKPVPLDLLIYQVNATLDPDQETTLIVVNGYDIKKIRSQVLRQMIEKTLGRTAGNVTGSAKIMGISRQCLTAMIDRLKISA